MLDAECHLLILRAQTEDAPMAGRAVETLSRIMMNKKDMEGAATTSASRPRLPRTVIKDGKTGADFYNEMASDKRFLPFLDEPSRIGGGKIKGTEERGSFPFTNQVFQFERIGEDLPFFQRHRLVLNTASHQVEVYDRLEKETAATSGCGISA